MKFSKNLLQGTVLLLVIAYLAYDRLIDKKIAYVDTILLVEEYNMKKEIAGRHQREFDIKKGLFDSLKTYFVLDTTSMEIRRQLFDLEQQLAAINEQYNGINVTVWNRINPLLASFGKEHGYDLIVGANGMGTVLYGKPSKDITKEVLEYINKEYEGR